MLAFTVDMRIPILISNQMTWQNQTFSVATILALFLQLIDNHTCVRIAKNHSGILQHRYVYFVLCLRRNASHYFFYNFSIT